MKEHFEDRSARARRHELSPADARKLDEELAASADARLWHRAGTEFDAEDAVLPGDHAASERVIQRLLHDLPRARPLRSRIRWVALLAAAAVLAASVAGAAALGARLLSKPAPLAPSASATPRPAATAPTAVGASAAPALDSAPGVEPAPAVIATAARAATPATPELPGTPADLFSAAGQARRRGDSRRALTLLESLQQRFPNSAEARSSDLTLGMLQLKGGAPGPALRHFDRYLARSPGGELAAEALWGRAQALFAQGNPSEGRRALGALLARFPGSAHASAARAKLAQP